MKTYDAAIIGGGLAGLTAAIDLAKGNKSVVLIEKASQCGGRAMTIDKNGVLLNLGAHALYKSGPAENILLELGIRIDGGSPSAKGTAIWKNKVVSLPHLLWTELSWPGKVEFGKIMLKLKKMDTNTLEIMTLRDWAEKEIHSPMVRHIFYALCRTATYTQDPDYLLVGPVLKQLQRSITNGVLYVNGGWQTIVDQLRELAIISGVEIMNDKKVVEIEYDQQVTGVIFSNGEKISTANVISTVSPGELYRLIRGAEKTSILTWKNQSRPAMAACLDLCLKKLPVEGRNVSIGIDQPVFFTNQSKYSRLSDNGSLVMHLVKYNGAAGGDPIEDQKFLEATMSMLHPGWEKEVVAKQYLPNMTVANDYLHMARTDRFPGPVVPEIDGLYIAGDWASHGEFLADAVMDSARRASLTVLKDLEEQKNRPLPIS
ncbi:FAD-dependent oxidoreductase [Paenibacillus sp. BSR1-1]|uniref:phytoene desaturase family protein n=1 Tax=Paenibacillus sp. BSR1-1 TaxID=3020845 RepID=UPI0025B0F9DA|nr:FAD-dependent oxidoreductase [Paenibacillus sp. BSR1-1]MDN3017211.1 FAD-dependent oxidoreductase [Paenibacillus sp. BSR1-1]